uniref:Hexosyltransferase n=1 Tax=Ciona intestinalis TaxID=7719 RepID=H2XRQ7_CIOIN
ILVLVKSSLEHNELRNIIRQTWGSIRNVSGVQVRTAFLIGMTSNSTLLRDVTNETRTFGDVILGSYYDTYKNLTVKALMGLKWNHLYCSRSSFFLLADDDAFINLRKIAQDYAIVRSPKSNEIQCGHILARHVLRRGKWAVSPEIYDLPYYPPYCWGPCFIMSKDVAEKIYLTSCHTHSDFAIDDVFVSGVLREKFFIHCYLNKCVWFMNGKRYYSICMYLYIKTVKRFTPVYLLLRIWSIQSTVYTVQY